MNRILRLTVTIASAVVLLAALPGAAFATPPGQEIPGESNLPFLLVGFALAWVVFFGYAFYVARKNRELKREIDELRQSLSDRNS